MRPTAMATWRTARTPRWLGLLLLFLSLSLLGCDRSPIAPPDPSTPIPTPNLVSPTLPASLQPAEVVRVVDGDTIRVRVDGVEYTVRYIGIDTPETKHPSKPVEWMGEEAAEANRQLVEGRTVGLEKDVSDTDRYGRLLRYVWVDGLMVNEELVRRGYAQVVTYPPDVKHQERFLAAQREAREAGRGLWGATPAPGPTPSASPESSPTPTAGAPATPSPDYWPCEPGQVKGNRNSGVYHRPDQRDYARTRANVECFDNASEAERAGYRPAQR